MNSTNKTKIISIISLVMALHMHFYPFAFSPKQLGTALSTSGVDISWMMMLNHVWHTGMTWGTDFVYTYGPLAFLATRISWNISGWVFVLSDIIIIANFYFIYKDFILNAYNKATAIILLVIFTALTDLYLSISFVFILFTMYWLYKHYVESKLKYLAIAAVFIIVAFYLKMNTGFLGILMLGLHLLIAVIQKRISLVKGATVLVAVIAGIVLCSFLFHVDLPHYIKGALEVINGYNNIMSIDIEGNQLQSVEYKILALYALSSLLFLFVAIKLIIQKKITAIIFPFFGLIFLFMLQKQCLVRNDWSHFKEYFSGFPLALLFLVITAKQETRKLVLISSCALTLLLMAFDNRVRNHFAGTFSGKITGQYTYIKDILNYDKHWSLASNQKQELPASIKKEIGDSTVDILPNEAKFLLAHELNYLPRPVFQSFKGYTDYLQDLNYRAYLKKLPEFVVYSWVPFDLNRHPFFDDCKLQILIAENYHLIDSFSIDKYKTLLLKKNGHFKDYSIIPRRTLTYHLKDTIPVRGSQMVKIGMNYNMAGKLKSLLNRAPDVHIMLQDEHGTWREYNTSISILQAGITVDKNITNTDEYIRYLGDRSSLNDIINIKIKADGRLFSDEMDISFCTIQY